MSDLAKCIRTRGSAKKRLTLVEKFIDVIKISEPDRKPSLADATIRINELELINKDFEIIQLELEVNCPEQQLEENYKEREQFKKRYYDTLSFLKTYIESMSANPTSNNSLSCNSYNKDPLQNIILPKIKLQMFKGDYDSWLEFKSNYLSTIHENASLTDSQKFSLLRASLEGYAKSLIDQIPFTDNLYQEAWNTLLDRFDKKYFLVDSHLNSILNIEHCSKESSTSFRRLLDNVSKNLVSLQNIGISKDQLWDFLIIHLVSSKLDKNTFREWKEKKFSGELPNMEEFLEFLKSKADILEIIHNTTNVNINSSSNIKPNKTKNHSHFNLAISNNNSNNHYKKCNFCKKNNHTIYSCSDFLKLNINQRKESISQLQLCVNCLRTGHKVESCYLGPCKICNVKHNSLIHEQSNNPISTNLFIQPQHSNTQILLSTVGFYVKDTVGNQHYCRALLDSGSQNNLITQGFCNKIDIPLIDSKLSIVGINQVTSHLSKKCNLTILSRVDNYQTTISCYVISNICSEIPAQKLIHPSLIIPKNIQLSDEQFFEPGEIDMLIGADLFWDLLTEGKIYLGNGLPILQNTKLGWVVSGKSPVSTSLSRCNFANTIYSEDAQLKRFWELEEVPVNSVLPKDESECENHFHRNTTRNEEGRFVVKLSLKLSPDVLGDSFNTACTRFVNLEKRFNQNNNFQIQYSQFIKEYISLNHMTKIDMSQDNPNKTYYYLPHHGVLKEESITTKLRVVFDGSCASSTGYSLNDLQYIGPKVQNDIISILLRFRMFRYVVSADITKMYRQILIHNDHKSLQRIVWRDNPEQDLSVYELNTVTYGTTSAPYLAIKCLQTLAQEHINSFPLASQTILKDFYVDDLLTGSNSISELIQTCQEVSFILNSAGFPLRKWTSNNPNVLQTISSNDDSLAILKLGQNDASKTLGIYWYSQLDILKYSINKNIYPLTSSLTKRQVLSDIAQIYDPLGLISPCIILGKIMIQKLWSLNMAWDEPIPDDLSLQWQQFRTELSELNQLSIPRYVIKNEYKLIEIHGFCDASRDAYAACIFARSSNSQGEFHVQLLCSKTKVAPLKLLTIPRLELCAALLLAQLSIQVKTSLFNLSNDIQFYYWSDSQVVLCWLKTDPNSLEIFVGNRVAKIQNLTSISNWSYINTKTNPADVASRGILPNKLKYHHMWWTGPEFLCEPNSQWPQYSFNISKSKLPELKRIPTTILSNISVNSLEIFTKFSSYLKLVRTIAYCKRFIHNSKNKNNQYLGPLQAIEVDQALLTLIKLAQKDSFNDTLILLSHKPLPHNHKLSSLCPFLDEQGILRVGGRLKYTNLQTNIKHPILISSNHPFTKLIFIHKHNYLLHPGPQLLLATVRQKYWPIGGKILAKKIVKNCIQCFRHKPVASIAPMGSLPNNRISPSFPFQVTGIDYAGPYNIKDRKGRGAKTTKGYICVFVCFVTKAIHLELISDMTTECFIACLRRFVSRRGIPNHIYSDNGKTFQGACNELNELYKFIQNNHITLIDYATSNNISWHFSPPYSPNFGGLWEAAVKSMKHHLKRTLLNSILTYEEFLTLIIQIEGILNSRPLYAISDDPNDYEPLTPSHFLLGHPITSLPSLDLLEVAENRITRLQAVQRLQQQFWNRFSKEYISQLHQLYKWKSPQSKLSVGSLVLIRNDHLPPQKWQLGRVLQLIPGPDGIHRVSLVSTTKGVLKRSVRHLHPLPLQDEASSSEN
ncbi:uncharacterized protein [Diabrotica undecimpunctata]|uniref:uncharacterized protein n=2 Tax=Diabrotica undecimpunctata TaxID=50387 RepID=UPI003B638B71